MVGLAFNLTGAGVYNITIVGVLHPQDSHDKAALMGGS